MDCSWWVFGWLPRRRIPKDALSTLSRLDCTVAASTRERGLPPASPSRLAPLGGLGLPWGVWETDSMLRRSSSVRAPGAGVIVKIFKDRSHETKKSDNIRVLVMTL